MRQSRITLLFILAVLQCTVGMAQLPNAIEIAPKMYPGWNLGNTLEGGGTDNVYTNNGGLGAEKAWQGTTTTQAIIDFVAAQGFKSVRLPAAWVMGHIIDGEEGMTIDAAWMARVKEIVDYCINANLYVLLNDHWDGGWIQGTFKKDISEPTIEKNCAKMRRLWSQIAEVFKDYDEHLLFAGLNEPEAETEAQTRALMTYEQAFIDAVRATGGNNASRTLVVQGPNTSIELSSKWVDMSWFNDPAKNALMIEVHYYSPPQFTGVWEGPNGDARATEPAAKESPKPKPSGLSLKAMMAEAEKGPATTAKTQTAANQEPQTLTLPDAWKALAESEAKAPRLSSAILQATPTLEGNEILFEVGNAAQKDWIDRNCRLRLESFLQRKLAREDIRLTVTVKKAEETGKGMYMPSDKAKYLQENSPEYNALRKDLELEVS